MGDLLTVSGETSTQPIVCVEETQPIFLTHFQLLNSLIDFSLDWDRENLPKVIPTLIFSAYYKACSHLISLLVDNETEELSPSQVDIRGFYNHNCLAFTIGALSSYSRHIRGLARSVIARFRLLSEAWTPTKIPSVPLAIAVMSQYPERVQVGNNDT